MEKYTNAPRSLILSTRLYQALLSVYPSDFRQAYGGPMLQVFRDSCQRALREPSTGGLLSLWRRTMLDTVKTALEEHAQRGADMSKEKFLKISGWALMLGGVIMSLGLLAGSRPQYNPFNALSQPADQVFNAVAIPVIVIGLLLLSLGYTGLIVRFGPGVGTFGRFGLGLGVLSGIISAAGAIGLGITDSGPWWSMFFLGLTIQFLGLTLFGVANLRQRTLPRVNGLPVITGVWLPLFVSVGLIIQQARGGVGWMDTIFPVPWLFSLLGLAGLGYLLQSDAQPAGSTGAVA